MAKPRIIIADTDSGYLMKLQQIFAEEFFGKIDLELISDPVYFERFFASPQRAQVLILSRDLYRGDLQRHNLAKIFVLTEEDDEETTEELNVHRVNKYSSIKRIFNEIVSKSAAVISVDNAGKQDPMIVVVTAAAGGVGKTTAAMGLASCLAHEYKRVLYLNCGQLQSFGCMLGNPAVITDPALYAGLSRQSSNVEEMLHGELRRETFYYLPPFKAALMSLGISNTLFIRFAEQARKSGRYDYVILDTDSYYDEQMARMMTTADRVILVTKPDRASMMATDTLVRNINGINTEKFIFLCNDVKPDAEKNGQDGNFAASAGAGREPAFAINESILHIDNYDELRGEDLGGQNSIRKAAFLLD